MNVGDTNTGGRSSRPYPAARRCNYSSWLRANGGVSSCNRYRRPSEQKQLSPPGGSWHKSLGVVVYTRQSTGIRMRFQFLAAAILA